MTTAGHRHRVTNTVTTPMGLPYYYRRHGVYYLRLRPVGSTIGHAVSLRTTDKAKAMTISKNLRAALQGFHLDNPTASWSDIRDAIKAFTLEALQADHSADPMQFYGMVYGDLRAELRGHAMTAPMSPPQSLGLETAIRALNGAERRLSGDLRPLNGLLEDLDGPLGQHLEARHSRASTSVPICITDLPLRTSELLTFENLSDAYMAEHKDNVTAKTLKTLRSSMRTLSGALSDTNMLTHNRDDMTALKASLGLTMAPATANKHLGTMTAVLDWAVNTGLITRHYAKGLKHRKDTDSDRKAFTQAQVTTIMSKAVEDLSDASRIIQLATVTGARLNEVATLVKEDVKEVAGVLVVSINDDHDHKSLKNRQSARLVPLVAALGFDLKGFLESVDKLPEGARLFTCGVNVGRAVNTKLRGFHGLTDDKDLVFHSLRHSMATAFKAKGVPLDHAQAIMGHATGSITFDLYGKGAGVDLQGLRESLVKALT